MKLSATLFSLGLITLLATSSFAAHVYSGIDLRSGKDVSIVRDDLSVPNGADKMGTVLIFMSAKCPCSMSHAEEVQKLSADYPEYRFIGVNSNAEESIEMAGKYFSSFPFPVLKDEKTILAEEFKAVKTPHAFILNKDGAKLFQGGVSSSSTFARADHKYLREALEDLKAGRAVRTPLARALGCSIERPSK